MRRVVVLLLALVLVPSIAAAAQYRCAYDQVARAACCCPAATHGEAPAPSPAIREACCCTLIASAPAVRSIASSPTPLELHAFVAPTTVAIAAIAAPVIAAVVRDRPRAQGDPPDSLFVRYCSFLL